MSTFPCWLNGEFIEATDLRIAVTDHGFTVGDGAFETIKVIAGKPFALTRHIQRLNHSLRGLRLKEVNPEILATAIGQVLSIPTDQPVGRLRVTVTSGMGPLGSDRSTGKQTIAIMTSGVTEWPDKARVCVVPWRRNEHSATAGLKTTSYAENVIALEAAHATAHAEAIFLDTTGRVSEGTGSNIFAVFADRIVTPSERTGLLAGITRNLLLEWAPRAGYHCYEDDFMLNDLTEANEVFITSSTRDIQKVSELSVLNASATNVTSITRYMQHNVANELRLLFKHKVAMDMNP